MNDKPEIHQRLWVPPTGKWILRQSWKDLLFIHWPVSATSLRNHVPKGLQIDTYKGQAWVGIVLFKMERIHIKGVPIPLFSQFPEINVRTYVTGNGKSGVFFLTLDAHHWVTFTLAKKWFHLPYKYSTIFFEKNEDVISFESIRKHNGEIPAVFKATYYPISEIFNAKTDTLEHWLTERYCFFSTDTKSNIFCGEIQHYPWELQRAKVEIHKNTLLSSLNICKSEIKPILHFSSGVESLIWNVNKH